MGRATLKRGRGGRGSRDCSYLLAASVKMKVQVGNGRTFNLSLIHRPLECKPV